MHRRSKACRRRTLLKILAVLAMDSDELVSTTAQESILALPIENFVEALNRQQALEPLFEFAAKNLAAKAGRSRRTDQKQELFGGTPGTAGRNIFPRWAFNH